MAALNQNNNDDEVMSTINIIPFVDIVLVLLIIFMVTSTSIVKAALKVELPSAASAGSAVETTMNIVFTKEKEIFFDGEQLSDDVLILRIQDAVAANPEVQAVISADKSLPYGNVVGIIDLVKQNGVKTFALNIERDVVARK